MSETNWHKIQRKLEGRCEICGGDLPDHIGVCPVLGEEIQKKYDNIDDSIKKIDNLVDDVLKKWGKIYPQKNNV